MKITTVLTKSGGVAFGGGRAAVVFECGAVAGRNVPLHACVMCEGADEP